MIEVREDDDGCSIIVVNGIEVQLNVKETEEIAKKLIDCKNKWIRKAIRGE